MYAYLVNCSHFLDRENFENLTELDPDGTKRENTININEKIDANTNKLMMSY